MRIDVIIPVYHPGERFLESLRRLCRQTRPVNRFIIMNTEQELWEAWEKELPAGTLPENLSVFHVTREDEALRKEFFRKYAKTLPLPEQFAELSHMVNIYDFSGSGLMLYYDIRSGETLCAVV